MATAIEKIACEEDDANVRLELTGPVQYMYLPRGLFWSLYKSLSFSIGDMGVLTRCGWTEQPGLVGDGDFAGIRRMDDGMWSATIRLP